MNRLPRAARVIPPSMAANPYPGRTPHWIKGNSTERVPLRWIVADTESKTVEAVDGQVQTLRCAVAVRWRADLQTGDHEEWGEFDDAGDFWRWVREHCYTHGRTTLAFHNAAHDLAILDAFTWLPALGYELAWCNLDRNVSVVTWRGMHGTLVIWDTYTWCPAALEQLAPLVGIDKPRLPADADSPSLWLARCTADVEITQAIVRELLELVRREHLGNWQPSGAGMGHTTWRHRFYGHKVLVHDDTEALQAERAAMHAGRAEAWWHGRARGGPFTEWDMHMSYCRIAAECDLPAKLREHDPAPSRRVHEWGLEHFRLLARVVVKTDAPVVPARIGDRTLWPVGEFETVLWDTELAALREAGGRYKVLEQWRYSRKPVLAEWARWSVQMCATGRPVTTEIQRTWIKHQSRAVIGRMGLRTASWERYSDNWMPWYTGLSLLLEEERDPARLMHIGQYVWRETDREEAQQSVPQITSWIMAEARARLWRACQVAGPGHVLHVDTDALIADAAGTAALADAAASGLPGHWRTKERWRSLEVTGPRHYRTPQRRQVPGVPRKAVEVEPGVYVGEVWDSLARSLSEGRTGERRVRVRRWEPQRVDHRRPYQGEVDGPAVPLTVAPTGEEASSDNGSVGGPGRAGQGDRHAPAGAEQRRHPHPRRARAGQR